MLIIFRALLASELSSARIGVGRLSSPGAMLPSSRDCRHRSEQPSWMLRTHFTPSKRCPAESRVVGLVCNPSCWV
ncbi:hypothetical protein BJX76DRAFT_315387 [Aspergillus varians]